MRFALIPGLAAALMLSVACAAEGVDTDTPGPDAAPSGVVDEPERPQRPDAPLIDAAVPLPCVEGDAQLSDPDTGHCYILLDAARNWTSASTSCADLGMHLATVGDDVENALILSLAGGREAWIGGNDILAENNWVWENDDPMSYDNWRAGEPNNAGGEDCMVFQGNQGGQWDDRPCGNGHDVICERDFDGD